MGAGEMAEHTAQWDCGRETDVANTRTGAPWGSADRTYEVTVGAIRYVLAVNHSAGAAATSSPTWISTSNRTGMRRPDRCPAPEPGRWGLPAPRAARLWRGPRGWPRWAVTSSAMGRGFQ